MKKSHTKQRKSQVRKSRRRSTKRSTKHSARNRSRAKRSGAKRSGAKRAKNGLRTTRRSTRRSRPKRKSGQKRRNSHKKSRQKREPYKGMITAGLRKMLERFEIPHKHLKRRADVIKELLKCEKKSKGWTIPLKKINVIEWNLNLI